MSKEFDLQRYEDAAHQMQCGVAMELSKDPTSATPKHLRVGINSAMVNDAALVRLLIAKGLFTEEEYYRAMREEMEREVERYKVMLRKLFGLRDDQNLELI